MTRIIYLPDEKTLIVTESPIPAGRLAEGLNSGAIPLGLPGAGEGSPLRALASGALVVVLGGAMLARASADPARPQLGWRERQVLQGMAEGLSTKQIASRLGLSERSVYTYIARLKEVLGAGTRVQIVRQGIALGLLGGG